MHLDPCANKRWYRLPDEADSTCHSVEVHLGFAFGRRFWGQGYAQEACRELIRYAFSDLRLPRLLGGAEIANERSIRLHERLGYRLHRNPDDEVVAVLVNPLAAYRVRQFEERDRQAANALGNPVIDWYHNEVPGASLHLVAEVVETGEIAGHLQERDRSVPDGSRRPGQCHFTLAVAPEHRGKRLGGCLFDRVEQFARHRKAVMLYTPYIESPNAPAASFLKERGFAPLEYFPSALDLTSFDPLEFAEAVERVERQGITLTTYAECGDSAENRLQLYALEEAAHAAQPFREVGPYVPVHYAKWEAEFSKREAAAIFLARAPVTGEFVGVVTGLEWYFTGTLPDWLGRGIATALKVRCIQLAKARNLVSMETENHEDNAAMLAINRKLGFVFSDPELACIKRL